MSRLAIGVVVLVVTLGCVTQYQPQTWTGGYTDMALGDDTFRVSVNGNGFTSQGIVESYLLRRCAELTISNGHAYFAFLNYDMRSHTSQHTSGGGSSTTRGTVNVQGNTAYYNGTTNYNGPQTYTVTKHGVTAFIQTFAERPEQGAFNASVILAQFDVDQPQ